jgi:hypothetical protein
MRYKVPRFTGSEGMSEKVRGFLYEQKEKMIQVGWPAGARTVMP